MRYIAVCVKGSHVQDVDWFTWVHRGNEAVDNEAVRFCRDYKGLRFERLATRGEGLASLMVRCYGCRSARTFTELVTKGALGRDGLKCVGRQPWQPEESVMKPCPHELVAVQRGATGNYIAETISALDIPEEVPPTAESDRIRAHQDFSRVVEDNGGPRGEILAGFIATDLDVGLETVLAVAAEDGTTHAKDDVTGAEILLGLKDGEWAAFQKKLSVECDRTDGDFVVDGARLDETAGPQGLVDMIAGVGQVRRVREVRMLRSFRRYSADADSIPVDLGADGNRQPFYPAVELFGEGIFLKFDEGRLTAWEEKAGVRARAEILRRRRLASPWAGRLHAPEPRYIALHTVAHLLIRRLAFESGYPSAALQERVYANSDRTDRTAGILIYTASDDAQGTLGGLVRLGEPARLLPLLVSALEDADLCSNDPVCIESDGQGASHLNLSACHGCSLVSETSCESGNRLLDRQLILGGSGVEGLFGGVLPEVRGNG